MTENRKVTFDFDGTLANKHIQDYAKELIALGFDVWIVTARFDDDNLHKWNNPLYNNEELWRIAEEVGIPKSKVVFMNMIPKVEYLKTTDAVWHIDDDFEELYAIKYAHIKTLGIQVNSGMWKSKCNRLLGLTKKIEDE